MGAAKEDLQAKQAMKDAEAKRRGTFYFQSHFSCLIIIAYLFDIALYEMTLTRSTPFRRKNRRRQSPRGHQSPNRSRQTGTRGKSSPRKGPSRRQIAPRILRLLFYSCCSGKARWRGGGNNGGKRFQGNEVADPVGEWGTAVHDHFIERCQ